ncbi:hypothetical protein BG015_000816 [Linnemannia schmuckeri]|uniref:Uncharacterized protein n=1 Tax=Linnemannia schmuckeri TaxID=64567 RepID=A0A9P5RQK0_9FUNG|nr:hypothetical protein BG015_000816 [Linnemannia schmuckeri]
MVVLSVSAQTMPSNACSTCITNAGISAVPACKGVENEKATGSTPTDKQKICWCGLKSNKNWADGCVGADKCSAESKEMLVSMINAGAAQVTCDNVSGTSAGNGFCGLNSAKVAAAGAAMAVVGALL